MLHMVTMEKWTYRIDVKLVSNKKDYLKCTSKQSYKSQKIFDNNLVEIYEKKKKKKKNWKRKKKKKKFDKN